MRRGHFYHSIENSIEKNYRITLEVYQFLRQLLLRFSNHLPTPAAHATKQNAESDVTLVKIYHYATLTFWYHLQLAVVNYYIFGSTYYIT